MKLRFRWMDVGKVVVAGLMGFGCGGSTSSGLAPNQDGGAPDGAASAFNPSGIGAMLGGNSDAGIVVGVTPQVADGCNALCAKEATANCPNQGTLGSCIVGCRVLLNNPNCTAATTSLLSCQGTSTVSCDANGKATLDSCGVQTLSSAACFFQNATDPTLQAPCATYCSKVAAANCPKDMPASCPSGCQILGGLFPACDPAWKAYVTCANSSTLTCGADGKAGTQACLAQAFTYFACFAQGASAMADAGP